MSLVPREDIRNKSLKMVDVGWRTVAIINGYVQESRDRE